MRPLRQGIALPVKWMARPYGHVGAAADQTVPMPGRVASMDSDSGEPAEVFARLVTELQSESGVEETVEAVLQFALHAVRCDHANMVLTHHGGSLEVVAATDPVAELAISMQLRVGQGPCLVAIADQVSVMVPDTVSENRGIRGCRSGRPRRHRSPQASW